MLARAGSIQKAEECLMSLINDGLSEAEQISLRRVIAKSTGTDPLYVCEAQYESSGALTDLIILVDLLEEQNDWKRLCHFGSLLLEKTQALPNAVRLGTALLNENRSSDLIVLLKKTRSF